MGNPGKSMSSPALLIPASEHMCIEKGHMLLMLKGNRISLGYIDGF